MTLNQVVNRIKMLALAHKQVRSFYQGLVSDFLTDQKTKYPAVFLQSTGGQISTSGHASTVSYRLFLLDLTHVSEDAKQNEQDIISDMLSVAMDLVAEMNSGNFNDWALSTDNNLQFVVENDNDLVAGCYLDISIRVMFSQNRCQVPTSIYNGSPIDTDMDLKMIFDTEYVATGDEGSSLIIPEIQGKKVLLITRENSVIYKTSSDPDSTEYTWDNTTVGLGLDTIPEQRFLILYRNY